MANCCMAMSGELKRAFSASMSFKDLPNFASCAPDNPPARFFSSSGSTSISETGGGTGGGAGAQFAFLPGAANRRLYL